MARPRYSYPYSGNLPHREHRAGKGRKSYSGHEASIEKKIKVQNIKDSIDQLDMIKAKLYNKENN